MRNGQIIITGSIITGVIAIGVFIAGGLGGWINKVDSKAEKALGQSAELRADISSIKTDVINIKENMIFIRDFLKNNGK